MRVFWAAGLLMLVGCATPQEVANQRRLEVEQDRAAEAAYVDRLSGRCQAFGYIAGNAAHSECMQRMHAESQATMRALTGAYVQGWAAEEARRDSQRGWNRPLVPPAPAIAPVQSSTCTRDYLGNYTCYTR